MFRLAFLTTAAGMLLGGCALFGGQPSAQTRSEVQAAVPRGSTVEHAQSALSSQGFECQLRKGPYVDGEGREFEAERVLNCAKRPGRVSFACDTRDQVFVLVDRGITGRVFVLRGPACSETP